MLTAISSVRQGSLQRSAVCLGSLFVLGYASWRCRRLATATQAATLPSLQATNKNPSLFSPAVIPYKSPEDPKNYKYIILPNQMHVLLVSSPSIDKAGVALNVNVGHLMDPKECQGLAHFCEHMMHLGSKQFPQEDGYKAWLSAHQGRSNASTNTSNTKYMFDIAPTYLKEGMERFAALFVAPLFTQSATGREVQAVHNEFAKNLNTDERRFNQVLRSWVRDEHPLSQFGTGNLDTLKLDDNGESTFLTSHLLAFYKEHYHARYMRLVVFGKENIDVLETWTRDFFSPVPDSPSPSHFLSKQQRLQKEVFEPKGHAQSPFACLFEVLPARDSRQLRLRFPLVKNEDVFREHTPHRVVSFLIGHEGPGSLLSYLKERGWASAVSAGTDWSVEYVYTFSIDISLTKEGLENNNLDEIMKAVFFYISMVVKCEDGVLERMFSEMKQIHDIKFRFKSEVEAFSLVSDLCRHMQDYTPERVLTAGSCFYTFSAAAVREVLACLRPDNMITFLVSKSFSESKILDRKEPIYGTSYCVSPIDSARSGKWQSAVDLPMALPRRNTLIPSDFTIKPLPASTGGASTGGASTGGASTGAFAACREDKTNSSSNSSSTNLPVVLESSAFGCLWHCQDNIFRKPKINFYCSFALPPSMINSIQVAVLSHLYTMILDDVLTEDVYEAELAGLKFGMSDNEFGFSFWVLGYNDKMYQFCASNVLPKLKNLNVVRFSFAKDRYERSLKSFEVAQPHSHASETISVLTQSFPRSWRHAELLAALQEVHMEDVQRFAQTVWQEGFLECLVHGNASAEDARRLFLLVASSLAYTPNLLAGQNNKTQFTFPQATNHVESTSHSNPNEPNSCCILLFYAGKYSIERHAALYLFSSLFRHPCFNQLRTREQLGYLVNSHLVHYKEPGELCFRIMVQSSSSSSLALNQRMNMFMEHFSKYLLDLEESAFLLHRQSAANKLLEKDDNLGQVSSRFWSEISCKTAVFDRSDQLAASVRLVSRQNLVQLWTDFFSIKGINRHTLASYSQCKKHLMDVVSESKSD